MANFTKKAIEASFIKLLTERPLSQITVKDIARASGYSVSTVSKALNNTDRVGAEATEKIKRIAKALGYQSSLSAQSLAGKQRKVAIVLRQSPAAVLPYPTHSPLRIFYHTVRCNVNKGTFSLSNFEQKNRTDHCAGSFDLL